MAADPFQRWQHEQDVATRHRTGRTRNVGLEMTLVGLGGTLLMIALVTWIR